MEIYHQYVKLRKQFGRHPKLTNESAEMIADVRPNEEHAKQYILRNPVITVTQCVPEMSEHEANTVAVILASKAMSHVEGGWPKDIDHTEAEHTIRCEHVGVLEEQMALVGRPALQLG
jgi:dynein intermediate chain 2, axonemal